MINRAIEALEARRFLSATLENGVLKVSGTAGDDDIQISIGASVPNPTASQKSYYVTINGTVSSFGYTQISRIVVRCGDGNDSVNLGASTYAEDAVITQLVGVRATVRGEGGNDSLYGGGRGSIVRGNEGNDLLSVRDSSGPITLEGGSGRDTLDGSRSSDLLLGGSGNDSIFGFQGDDRIFGGSGHDTLTGSDGDDLIIGGSGLDMIGGDAGDDLIVGGTSAWRHSTDLESIMGGLGKDQFSLISDQINELLDFSPDQDAVPFQIQE